MNPIVIDVVDEVLNVTVNLDVVDVENDVEE